MPLLLIIIFTDFVNWNNLESFILSCGNLAGTLFIIFGLGYGLIKFPKQFLDDRSIKSTVKNDCYTIGTSKLEKQLMKERIEQKYYEMVLYEKLINDESICDNIKYWNEMSNSLKRIKNVAKSVLSEIKCETILNSVYTDLEKQKSNDEFSKTVLGKKINKINNKLLTMDIGLDEIFKLESSMKIYVSTVKNLQDFM